MADIDIGSAAVDRASDASNAYTYALYDNPANASGSITSVEMWAYYSLSNCEVATFVAEGSNVFSTRDSETIGSVTAGSKQTFSGLAMDVETGDYIGGYWSAGLLERDNIGYSGYAYLSGDHIPCSSVTFSTIGNRTMSLYGEGEVTVTEKTSSDTGSGVDACVSLETPEAKTSADAGSGVEGSPLPAATLASSESGSGIEAANVFDEGLLKDLLASELGQGADCLIAKIEMPTKGGGMKLWT
jgi:hypothetical protein